MAKITKDSFNDAKNRKAVIAQIGTPVVDSELNELQKILFVDGAEDALLSGTALRGTDVVPTAQPRFVFAAGSDCVPFAVTTPTIHIGSGSLLIDGARYTLSNSLDLTTAGLTFPVVGGSAIYGILYADFVLAEVNSIGDPSIAHAQLGETAVRLALQATWKQSESTVGFQDAFNGMTALPNISNPRLWKGNTTRGIIARYLRPAGSTNIDNTMIVDMRQPLPAEARQKTQVFVKGLTASGGANEGNGLADGMIAWDATTGYLRLGISNADTGADGARTGLLLKVPGSLTATHLTMSTGTVWAATGAGNADGTMRQPDFTGGWLLADGKALGYTPLGGMLNTRASKAGNAALYSASPLPSALDRLLVQDLTVQNLEDFQADPSALVLCTRMGLDLVWWNGHVTRGSATTSVIDVLGGVPSEYDAVVGTTGNNHATQADGLERVLNHLADGLGVGTLGATNKRSPRVYARRGNWQFVRKIHSYGTLAEQSGSSATYSTANNTIDIRGAGPDVTKLSFLNPQTSGRTVLDVCTIAAARVSLRGMTIAQNAGDATFTPGATLLITGKNVVLEDMDFVGPVRIVSDRVRLKNCRFYPLGNTVANLYEAANSVTNPVAQHLNLVPATASNAAVYWNVQGCDFLVGNDVGTHAAVVLNTTTTSSGRVRFRDCHWDHAGSAPTGEQASVAINTDLLDIQFDRCTYANAGGAAKAGYASTDTAPYDGNYNGTYLKKWTGGQITATAYISVARGRASNSRLHLDRCSFDFSSINLGASHTSLYTYWGACLATVNRVTTGLTSAIFAIENIAASRCELNMEVSGGGTAWVSPSPTQRIPVLFGFYAGGQLADTNGSGLRINNVHFDDNIAKIGAGTTAALANAWRSIIPTCDPGTAVRTAGVFTVAETSTLFGVVAGGRGTVGAVPFTLRMVCGSSANRNKVLQQHDGSDSGYLNSVIEVTAANQPGGGKPYAFLPVIASMADPATATLPADYLLSLSDNPAAGAPFQWESGGSGVVGVDASSNTIIAPYLYRATSSGYGTGIADPTEPRCHGITLSANIAFSKIQNNNILLGIPASPGSANQSSKAIVFGTIRFRVTPSANLDDTLFRNKHCSVTGNVLRAYDGVVVPANESSNASETIVANNVFSTVRTAVTTVSPLGASLGKTVVQDVSVSHILGGSLDDLPEDGPASAGQLSFASDGVDLVMATLGTISLRKGDELSVTTQGLSSYVSGVATAGAPRIMGLIRVTDPSPVDTDLSRRTLMYGTVNATTTGQEAIVRASHTLVSSVFTASTDGDHLIKLVMMCARNGASDAAGFKTRLGHSKFVVRRPG